METKQLQRINVSYLVTAGFNVPLDSEWWRQWHSS